MFAISIADYSVKSTLVNNIANALRLTAKMVADEDGSATFFVDEFEGDKVIIELAKISTKISTKKVTGKQAAKRLALR